MQNIRMKSEQQIKEFDNKVKTYVATINNQINLNNRMRLDISNILIKDDAKDIEIKKALKKSFKKRFMFIVLKNVKDKT